MPLSGSIVGHSSLEVHLAESQSPDEDPPEEDETGGFNREEFLNQKLREEYTPKKARPYEISPEEFDAENGFAKRFLNLYDGDGAITDEHDVLVEDWRSSLGVDGPSHLEVDESVQTVYIRNDKLQTDYELTRVNGNFFEEGEVT